MSTNLEEGQQGGTPPAQTGGTPPPPAPKPKKEPPKVKLMLARGKTPPAVNGSVVVGSHGVIKLPGLEEQKEGFELDPDDAALLQAQYGTTYKPFVPLAVPVPVSEGQGEAN